MAALPRRHGLRTLVVLLASASIGAVACGGRASFGETNEAGDVGPSPVEAAGGTDGSLVDAPNAADVAVDGVIADADSHDGETTPDVSESDGGLDATPEAATLDGEAPDSGTADSGVPDSGVPDSGVPDSGVPDSGVPDSGAPDSGASDGATEPDAGGCSTAIDGGIGSLTAIPGDDAGACAIALPGPVTHVAYDPVANVAYGIDPTDQTVSTIALATHAILYRTMPAVPNAICVNPTLSRLYVVETGSTFIDELSTADLSLLRRIPWPAPSVDSPDQSRFQVYCGKNRLFVVDSNWEPGLWTVDNLDGCPVVVDHTTAVAGVGGLVLSPDESEFYYWYEYGHGAGWAGTEVYRVDVGTWAIVDQTRIPFAFTTGFYRDPFDTPILWDHTRNLIFAKNRVFDANSLTTVVHTFSDPADAPTEAYENAYAMEPSPGLLVTRHHVFSTDTFTSVGTVTDSNALQYFVGSDGVLRALTSNPDSLDCQTLP